MTIEELNNFKLKERLSSKKRHVILCIETNEIFNSERELSKILNITRNKVSNILKNKTPYNNLTYIIIQ